jgi:isocitrate dehydrogenase (NAD+)
VHALQVRSNLLDYFSSLGIGPEISQSVKDIYTAAGVCDNILTCAINSSNFAIKVPIEWEEVSVAPILKGGKTVIPDAAIHSIKKNTVALKGVYFFFFAS